jgi:hypothetical protein
MFKLNSIAPLIGIAVVGIALCGCGSSQSSSEALQPAAVGSPVPAVATPKAAPKPLVDTVAIDKAWKKAVSANTESAYDGFAAKYPSDPRVPKARTAAAALAWKHAENAGTVSGFDAFAMKYPNDPRAAKARQLEKGDEIRLTRAISRHLVTVRTNGDGLQNVSVTIKRLVKRPLKIDLPVGTYFVSGGDSQNMVSCEADTADLTDSDSADLTVRAACANFYLAQPDQDNRFQVRDAHPNRSLRKLLKVIGQENPSSISAQLAIWSLTDNPSRDEASGHVMPSPSDEDFHEAAKLLRSAGIRPSSRAMFQ